MKKAGQSARRVGVGLLPLIVVLAFISCLVVASRRGGKPYDFPVFYYAAHMVSDGARTSLYDLNAQRVFQARYNCWPEALFYYPAFSLLPYLPLGALPTLAAFAVWTILSIAVLIVSMRSLSRLTRFLNGYWPVVVSLAFLPVIMNFLQGQLAILIFGIYVWCCALWKDGRRFAGGLVLSLATIKFQLVIGFVSVLVFKRKWKELAGFATGSVPIILVSAAIVGIPEFLRYPQFMLHRDTDSIVHPGVMANLRGLVSLLLGNGDHRTIVACMSVGVLVVAASLWKDLESGFSSGILATMLVSYHFNPQDLSLALIPICLASQKLGPRAKMLIAAGVVGLPWLIFTLGGIERLALLAVPMISTLVWLRFWKKDSQLGVEPSASQSELLLA